MKRLVLGFSLVVVVCCVLAAPALAAPSVTGTFPVKSLDGSNSKIVAGPDGNIWLTQTGAGSNVTRITPSGAVTEFELGLLNVSGIAPGPEGRLWVTATNEVASFLPADPKNSLQKTTIISIAGVSPIVAGPDGQMWVATQETVLHFTPSNPAGKQEIPVPGLQPKDIDVAGSLLVVADGNAEKKRIATFTTAGVENDYPTGNAAQGVAGGGPGGQFAFSAPDAKEAGLVTPPGPPKATTVEGDPFGVAFASDGAYWYARSAKDDVARLTTNGEVSFVGGFPAKFFPRQITAGPDNTLWVTMEIPGENIYEVARISGLEPPVPPVTVPETKIAKGPKKVVKTAKRKVKVKFRFSSTAQGASFECALTKLRKGKKQPQPVFKSCKSPRSYSLKPGRYRFRVRAVLAGQADQSPASRTFRVVHVKPKHKR